MLPLPQNQNHSNSPPEQCAKCKRSFKTSRGLNQHTRVCTEKQVIDAKVIETTSTTVFPITNATVDEENIWKADRRLNQWKDGQIEKLLVEAKTIQEKLFKDSAKNRSSDRKATLFARFMEDGKVNKALKLLESSNKGGILRLTEEIFEVLLEKLPKASEASNDILIQEEVQNIL